MLINSKYEIDFNILLKNCNSRPIVIRNGKFYQLHVDRNISVEARTLKIEHTGKLHILCMGLLNTDLSKIFLKYVKHIVYNAYKVT